MNFKMILALLVTTLALHTAHADEELIYDGHSPERALVNKELSYTKQQSPAGREQIRYFLDLESRVRTVGEAIELKTRGLSYVENIFDFEYLTSTPFANPSDAYKKAVGDFIVQYVGNFVRSSYDIQGLFPLEARVPFVNQAIAVKSAGLRVRMQIEDYLRLIPPAVSNPSDAYRTAISTFTAQNIRSVLDSYSRIYLIVEAERYTLAVGDAMTVKNAGLVAVRTQRDLFELARFSVPNPSDAYQQAVNNFLRENMGRYPQLTK